MKRFFKKKEKKPAVAIDRRRRMRSLTDVVEKKNFLSFFFNFEKMGLKKIKRQQQKKKEGSEASIFAGDVQRSSHEGHGSQAVTGFFFFTEFYRVSLGCDGRRLAFAEEKSVSAHWNSVKLGNSFWPWSYLIFLLSFALNQFWLGFDCRNLTNTVTFSLQLSDPK